MLTGREYFIEDDGGEYQLSLLIGGVQVGGALFPADIGPCAYALAEEIGEAFINKSDQTLSAIGYVH